MKNTKNFCFLIKDEEGDLMYTFDDGEYIELEEARQRKDITLLICEPDNILTKNNNDNTADRDPTIKI